MTERRTSDPDDRVDWAGLTELLAPFVSDRISWDHRLVSTTDDWRQAVHLAVASLDDQNFHSSWAEILAGDEPLSSASAEAVTALGEALSRIWS